MTVSRHLRMTATAIVCALALWAYLDAKLSSERAVRAPVEVAPPAELSVRFIDGDAAKVVLRGNAERMAPPVFMIDARGMSEGEYEVRLDRRLFRAAGGVTVVSVEPETIRFALVRD